MTASNLASIQTTIRQAHKLTDHGVAQRTLLAKKADTAGSKRKWDDGGNSENKNSMNECENKLEVC
jgi:hypothetical protein